MWWGQKFPFLNQDALCKINNARLGRAHCVFASYLYPKRYNALSCLVLSVLSCCHNVSCLQDALAAAAPPRRVEALHAPAARFEQQRCMLHASSCADLTSPLPFCDGHARCTHTPVPCCSLHVPLLRFRFQQHRLRVISLSICTRPRPIPHQVAFRHTAPEPPNRNQNPTFKPPPPRNRSLPPPHQSADAPHGHPRHDLPRRRPAQPLHLPFSGVTYDV
jgi:hypothetical protein